MTYYTDGEPWDPSTLNVELLRKGVEWVEWQDKLDIANRAWVQEFIITPEQERVAHYKHAEGCGTAYCLGGYIADLVEPKFAEQNSWIITGDDGRTVAALAVASDALGLPDDHGLFDGSNSAADIREIAENLAGGPL